jgi:antitoxin (DNA-binding transcriptional repressor) of toxin-antitoxin stability system
MKTVTTEYAAAHLEELLTLVALGESVLLSMNGRPVARLLRIDDDDTAEVPASEVEEAFYGD